MFLLLLYNRFNLSKVGERISRFMYPEARRCNKREVKGIWKNSWWLLLSFIAQNFYALSIKFDISFTHYFKLTFYALDLQKSKWNEWWISNKAIYRYFNIGGVDWILLCNCLWWPWDDKTRKWNENTVVTFYQNNMHCNTLCL